jgi:hypothetical protein
MKIAPRTRITTIATIQVEFSLRKLGFDVGSRETEVVRVGCAIVGEAVAEYDGVGSPV